jgi:hypothetical protein
VKISPPVAHSFGNLKTNLYPVTTCVFTQGGHLHRFHDPIWQS